MISLYAKFFAIMARSWAHGNGRN